MYLLDTNIVIFLFKGHESVTKKIKKAKLSNCFISEITVVELKYGAAKSNRPNHHNEIIENFIQDVGIIPIFDVIDEYAQEKVRLEKEGNRIDDFDLLIGVTAVANNLTLVTNNTSHLRRIRNIKIEDWTSK